MLARALIADRYEIKEILGEGGMGVVYRAIDIKTKSSVALKTMRDVSDPAAVELFSKEWSVLANISHPNIVDIRDVGEIEERGQRKPFFVMPLLPGTTLGNLIDTSSARLTVERVIAIMMQVCRGLQAAHEQGLVHRDIKPNNIFVMEDDTAKIIDFGVAHLAGVHSVTGHKGTWQYMAPEQIDLKPVSPVSDIFSLGVVCYETLTGRKPFACKTPSETADAIRRHIPPPISEINHSVSQLISMVIHKAMAKQPMHRFSSARDFGDTLQKAFLNQPIERFDRAKIQPRIERARKTLAEGDSEFASEILMELETEGHIDPEINVLRLKIDQTIRQRKIRQLLESARTRVEQDEIPLALEKLKELLEIDPDNGDAHAMKSSIEKQRSARQIESWLTLARRHLERHDFSEARQALKEVLKIRPADSTALMLLHDTDRREQDTLRIRTEKEQLYGSAMRAYNNGEISSALSRLERLLDLGRQTPDASVPERDALYQSLYNQIRSESDAIHNAYQEARRHLAEHDFARTLEICDEFAAKYPADAIFQALKLEAVEQQRQELSTYIAEIGRRVDAEADLDRKVNIFKEACDRYPQEQQFQQSLKLTRERRDLVLSIVAKARHYEEKSLFTEAIGQWDILRNIYPRYPGIELELGQLVKRRNEQAREESKARLIEQVDISLGSGEYARARDLAVAGLAEYPQDHELVGLERLARQGLQRSSEAQNLCAQAMTLCAEGRYGDATQSLRQALELDSRNQSIREALLNALVEQARLLMDQNWREAEPLIQQASDLDAAHPGPRSLRALIGDLKRKELVSQSLAEARDLQAAGDLEAALSKVEGCLAQYPNETRLTQLQSLLQNSVRETRSRKERADDIDALKGIRQTFEEPPTIGEIGPLLERSQAIQRRYPDDPEVGHLVAEIHQRAGEHAPTVVDLSPPPAEVSGTFTLLDKTASGYLGERAAAAAVTGPLPETAISSPAPEPAKSDTHSNVSVQAMPSVASTEPIAVNSPKNGQSPLKKFSRFQMAIAACTLILVSAAIIVIVSKRGGAKKPVTAPSPVDIQAQVLTTPVDATVTVNGEPRSGTIQLKPDTTYDVVVSRVGYKTFHETAKRADREWKFVLDPEPLKFSLMTSEKVGKVFVDYTEKGELQNGTLQNLEFPADGASHVFAVRNGSAEILSFTFSAKPAEAPGVSSMKPRDLMVVSSLANEATVYSGSTTLRAQLPGQEFMPISPAGLKLSGLSASNNELTFSSKDIPKIVVETGNAPFLYVGLNADVNIAYLNVQSNVDTARLLVDGLEVKSGKPGNWPRIARTPGTHTIALTADGYEDHQEQVDFVKGKPLQLSMQLKPKVVITTAYLIVEGGTPGSEVLIDGVSAKTLDSSGSAKIEVSPAPHKIQLRKQYFEPSQEISRAFSRGQEVRLGANDARLKEFGTIQFQVTPADAQVNYHRVDQREFQHARSRDSVRVPEGKYTVTVEAPGYAAQAKSDVNVASGQSIAVEIALSSDAVAKKPEIAAPRNIGTLFEHPEEVKPDGEWWKGSTIGEYVSLKPGIVSRFKLIFLDPGKSRLGTRRKVEWALSEDRGRRKVTYEFDGKKLSRKASGKSKPFSTTCDFPDKIFQFDVAIEHTQVMTSSPSCAESDTYVSEDQDFSAAQFGIKPNLTFVIR